MELMAVLVVLGFYLVLFLLEQVIYLVPKRRKRRLNWRLFHWLLNFKSEFSDFPVTEDSSSEDECAKVLFMTLSGWMDIDGVRFRRRTRKIFLTIRQFTLGKKEGESIEVYSLTTEEILGNSGVNKEIFMIDPWENPYVYQYPRLDGHSCFLLFSRGPDGRSSQFRSELTSTPEKQAIDLDNIPDSERKMVSTQF